jgi:septum site-determining protein MinC
MKVLTLEQIDKEEPKEDSHIKFEFDDQAENVSTANISEENSPVVDFESKISEEVELEDVVAEVLQGDLTLGDKTVFHRGTLRSGRRIESDGHIIVLGDVNPGAELSAAGNIVVMGSLRGFVQAGRDGDDQRCVVALKLQPTQIRIGKWITRPPDEGHEGPGYPEIAVVKENRIIIEPYR